MIMIVYKARIPVTPLTKSLKVGTLEQVDIPCRIIGS